MSKEVASSGKVTYTKVSDDMQTATPNDSQVLIDNNPAASSEKPIDSQIVIDNKPSTSANPINSKIQIDVHPGNHQKLARSNEVQASQTQTLADTTTAMCQIIFILCTLALVVSFIFGMITLCAHWMTVDTLKQANHIVGKVV